MRRRRFGRLWSTAAGVLLLASSPGLTQTTQPALSAPALSCRVQPDLPQDQRTGSPTRVSNLKRITLTPTLSHPSLPNDELLRAELHPQAPPDQKRNLEISVFQVAGRKKTQVVAKVAQTGHSGTNTEESALLQIEIPLDPAKRRENIRKYLDRLEVKLSTTREDKTLLELLRQNREAYIDMFDRHYYVENRVGLFEIRCAYLGTRPDFWIGRVQAPPAMIQVIFQGNFFDQAGNR